jgi:hypothetical protein
MPDSRFIGVVVQGIAPRACVVLHDPSCTTLRDGMRLLSNVAGAAGRQRRQRPAESRAKVWTVRTRHVVPAPKHSGRWPRDGVGGPPLSPKTGHCPCQNRPLGLGQQGQCTA